MRIRRRDKESTEKASAPREPVLYDQELSSRPESMPTSTDPVKNLEADPVTAPPPASPEPEAVTASASAPEPEAVSASAPEPEPQPEPPPPPPAADASAPVVDEEPQVVTTPGAGTAESLPELAGADSPGPGSLAVAEAAVPSTGAAVDDEAVRGAHVARGAHAIVGGERGEAPSASPVSSLEQVAATMAPIVETPPDPDPEPAVAAQARKEPTMRPPTIGEDATELLNGAKPTVRELPRVIAVANQKGGVGKTTTTVNLGAALAEMDYRVLVIDLDPQGNATTGLGVEARNFEMSMYDVIMRDQPLEDCIEPTSVKHLFVAPATIDLAGVEIELVPAFSRELKLKKAIDTVVDDFDFVLIDCPPSLGLITVNGLAAAQEVLVPIQCEYYALEGLSQLLRNVNLVSSNLNETLEVSTIVLTMYDARTRLSVDVANEVREHFADRVCRMMIPRTVRLSEAPSFGQPITVFDPASRGAVAYRELAKEVSNGAPQRTR